MADFPFAEQYCGLFYTANIIYAVQAKTVIISTWTKSGVKHAETVHFIINWHLTLPSLRDARTQITTILNGL